jgi:A/G-specific adenine glycosylase
MHQAAKIICKEYGGKLPENQEELLKLPGVGEYISAAVGSIAFHLPAAVLDGNVKRILARLFMEPMPVNDAASKKHFGDLARRILNQENPGQFNQAMMELGQRVCKPKGLDCGHCPLRTCCKARKKGMTASYPVKIPKKPIPLRKMIFAVVIRKGKWLIIRRPDTGLLGGLWEFPGKEILPAQNSDDEVAGMVVQKTGIQVKTNRKLGKVRHVYTHFRVSASVYLCDYVSGKVQLTSATDHLWIQPEEMRLYPFHKMIHKMVALLDSKTLL